MIHKLLVLGHVIGDFYLQSDQISKEKEENIKALIIHSVLYGLSLVLTTIIVINPEESIKYIVAILGCMIFHGIFDYLKNIANKALNCKIKHKTSIFVIDQILHVISVFAMFFIMKINICGRSQIMGMSLDINNWEEPILYLICVLICAKPTSILVKTVFEDIKNKARDNDNTSSSSNEENPKIGSYIGILEREIIFILGSMGQFGVIGFVLTAKSIARFKQLEDKKFAEKYLVGTLLSSLIAIVSVVIYINN